MKKLDDIINEDIIRELLKEGRSPVEVLNLLNASLDQLIDQQELTEWKPKFKLKLKPKPKIPTKRIVPGKGVRFDPAKAGRGAKKANVSQKELSDFSARFRSRRIGRSGREAGPRIKGLMERANKIKGFQGRRALKLRAVAKIMNIVFKPLRGKSWDKWGDFPKFIFKAFVVGAAMQAVIPKAVFGEDSPFYGKDITIWEFITNKNVTDALELDPISEATARVPDNFDAELMLDNIEDFRDGVPGAHEPIDWEYSGPLEESFLRQGTLLQEQDTGTLKNDPSAGSTYPGKRVGGGLGQGREPKVLQSTGDVKARGDITSSIRNIDDWAGYLHEWWISSIGTYMPKTAEWMRSAPAISGTVTFFMAMTAIRVFMFGGAKYTIQLSGAFARGAYDCDARSAVKREGLRHRHRKRQYERTQEKNKVKWTMLLKPHKWWYGIKWVFGSAAAFSSFPVWALGKLGGIANRSSGGMLMMILMYRVGSVTCKNLFRNSPWGAARHALIQRVHRTERSKEAFKKLFPKLDGKTDWVARGVLKAEVNANMAFVKKIARIIKDVCRKKGAGEGQYGGRGAGLMSSPNATESDFAAAFKAKGGLFDNLAGDHLSGLSSHLGHDAMSLVLAKAIAEVSTDPCGGGVGARIIYELIFLAVIYWGLACIRGAIAKVQGEDPVAAAMEYFGYVKSEEFGQRITKEEREKFKEEGEYQVNREDLVELDNQTQRNTNQEHRDNHDLLTSGIIKTAVDTWDEQDSGWGTTIPKECFKDSQNFNASECCKLWYVDYIDPDAGLDFVFNKGCCKASINGAIPKRGDKLYWRTWPVHTKGWIRTPIIEKIGPNDIDNPLRNTMGGSFSRCGARTHNVRQISNRLSRWIKHTKDKSTNR